MDEEKKQSSKVTNFMRMVGNMSSSVDYRVITIIDAPGMEKRGVTVRKSDQQRGEEKNRDTQ